MRVCAYWEGGMDAARADNQCVRAVRVTMTWVHIASIGSHPNVFAVHLFSSFTDADLLRHRDATTDGDRERRAAKSLGRLS